MQTPRLVKNEGEEVFQVLDQKFSCNPFAGTDIHTSAGGSGLKVAAAHGEPKEEQAPGQSCSLWIGGHNGISFLT